VFGAAFTAALILTVIDRLTGPLGRAAGSVARFQAIIQGGSKKLRDWGDKVSGWGKSVSIAAAAGAAALWGILRPTAAIDKATRALQTVVTPMYGSMEADLKRVRAAADDWSRAHVGAADQFITTSYQMVSAGLNTAQAIAGTRAATALATATFGDATDAAGYLATLYNNMGRKAGDAAVEMTRLADITAKTQQFHQLSNLGQLTEGMKYAVPVAKMYGISLEQVSAAIGTLNDSGITGGQAGTTFSAIMRGMNGAAKDLKFTIARTADGGVDLIGTMEALKAKFGSRLLDPKVQKQLQEAFGDEGVKGIMSLMDKTGRLRESMTAMAGATGTVATALKTVEGGIDARLAILKQQAMGALVKLGEKLVPLLDKLVPKFTAIIDKVVEWVDKNPELAEQAVQFFAIGTGIAMLGGPLLMAVGSVMKLVGGFLALKMVARLAATAAAGAGASGAAGAAGATAAFGPLLLMLLKVAAVLLILRELFNGFKTVRGLVGAADEFVHERGAENQLRRAQQILADPKSTATQRRAAQGMLSQAGWNAAISKDIRRDIDAGSYLASEQPRWINKSGYIEHAPASAPRHAARLDVMAGVGGIQSQEIRLPDRSLTDVLGGFGMPALPAPGQTGVAAPGATATPGPMRVEDPEQRRVLEGMAASLERTAARPLTVIVPMPDGSTQTFQGLAAEGGY